MLALRRDRPELLEFLEIGVDLERGVDDAAREWVRSGAPATYHFLDLNLEERDDLEPAWVEAARALATALGAAWLCGDAGLWHVGPRDRGHGVLLPPVLTAASARVIAANVRRLREATGLEVLPENPPAHAYPGDLHLLDYFARVADAADAGLLLDVAHLAIYQRATGRAPLDGLDGFPLDRVVELHVAGGTEFESGGRCFVDDDHGPEPIADTWRILEAVLPRAASLRAVVYECERNPRAAVLPNFERLRALTRDALAPRERVAAAPAATAPAALPIDAGGELSLRRAQRALVRMQHDAAFALRIARGEPDAIASAQLDAPSAAWLRALDPAAVAADRDGRRAAQLLRNVGSEFRLSAAVGPSGDGDAWTREFPRSPFFHGAIAGDASLPLAFAAFAGARARDGMPLFAALVALETAMAQARRCEPAQAAPPRGAVRLAAAARVLELPAGTHAAAAAIAERLDRGAKPGPLPRVSTATRESVLIVADARADARFGRLRPIRVEPLAELVAAFLAAARAPLDGAACAAFAEAHGIAAGDLADVVEEYVAEGVLVRGAAAD